MTSFAGEMLAEAKAKPGEVIARKIAGWSFCLSFGPVDPTKTAEAVRAAGLKLQFAGKDVTEGVVERLKAAGWIPPKKSREEAIQDYEAACETFAAARGRLLAGLTPKERELLDKLHEKAAVEDLGVEADVPRDEWMLSAKLWPLGRASTEKDWTFLGQMVAALGAPADSATRPIELVQPHETFYWRWREQPT